MPVQLPLCKWSFGLIDCDPAVSAVLMSSSATSVCGPLLVCAHCVSHYVVLPLALQCLHAARLSCLAAKVQAVFPCEPSRGYRAYCSRLISCM